MDDNVFIMWPSYLVEYRKTVDGEGKDEQIVGDVKLKIYIFGIP